MTASFYRQNAFQIFIKCLSNFHCFFDLALLQNISLAAALVKLLLFLILANIYHVLSQFKQPSLKPRHQARPALLLSSSCTVLRQLESYWNCAWTVKASRQRRFFDGNTFQWQEGIARARTTCQKRPVKGFNRGIKTFSRDSQCLLGDWMRRRACDREIVPIDGGDCLRGCKLLTSFFKISRKIGAHFCWKSCTISVFLFEYRAAGWLM